MAKRPTIETIDASLARWKTRLKRAITMIGKLEKQKKRLAKAVATKPAPAKPEPLAVTIMREMVEPAPTPVKEPAEIDTSIPAFLQRPKISEADAKAAAEIVAGQKETKRLKAVGRAARKAAEKRGETRKMPLSGKAALEAIRNG